MPERGASAGVRSIAPWENTFETVMVDVTHRCNMACANCYLPNRDIPDMDIARLEDCLAAFPRRTSVRIAGAEPTLRRDLPEIIETVRRTGHRAVLLTNGLRLAREPYVRELKDAGLRHVNVSVNGAGNDDWYEAIDRLRCASRKLRAVENVVANGMLPSTGTILVRGLNEGAVREVYEFVKALKPRRALLAFKNVGALGRYDSVAEARNLDMGELESLSAAALGTGIDGLRSVDRFRGTGESNTMLFPADLVSRPGNGIGFKLRGWQADGAGNIDPRSTRRGRVTEDFRIAPFFEHVKANEGGY